MVGYCLTGKKKNAAVYGHLSAPVISVKVEAFQTSSRDAHPFCAQIILLFHVDVNVNASANPENVKLEVLCLSTLELAVFCCNLSVSCGVYDRNHEVSQLPICLVPNPNPVVCCQR